MLIMNKITISHKGKTRKVPKKYVPTGLNKADKNKQIKSIVNKTDRPQTQYKSKRSSYTVAFEKKYGFNIKSPKVKTLITQTGIKKILDKGRGAYYSSGSRPNQTSESWAYARLASVLMNGPARKVDKDIYDKYKK